MRHSIRLGVPSPCGDREPQIPLSLRIQWQNPRWITRLIGEHATAHD